MSKIQRVVIVYDDKIMSIEGKEAEKWQNHNAHVGSFAAVHNHNPFDYDPIKWEILDSNDKVEDEELFNDEYVEQSDKSKWGDKTIGPEGNCPRTGEFCTDETCVPGGCCNIGDLHDHIDPNEEKIEEIIKEETELFDEKWGDDYRSTEVDKLMDLIESEQPQISEDNDMSQPTVEETNEEQLQSKVDTESSTTSEKGENEQPVVKRAGRPRRNN